ncbi:alpha/beta fold hydrolase [Pseudofulvibacter geojedonensis]|uniref:Alpha/beta fold hydrolase n=1 Tax=Pseudofulvibacter geojedonensis TaxID=1123758 RepID=A0ABW3I5Q8_9FLAO
MNPVLHSKILGEGQPLLILHGFLGMSDNWKTLGNKFLENFQVHLIDQRNHGRSFHHEDFSYDVLVQDLKQYIDFHQLKNCILLGHSMGGKTVMQFALEYPDLVSKLIVADIAPKVYPAHHQYILKALSEVDFSIQKSRKEIEVVLKEYIKDAGVVQFLMKNVYRKEKTELAYRFNLPVLINRYEEVIKTFEVDKFFNKPVLFLKGGNSNYINSSDEIEIERSFLQAEIATIQGAGHWLHAEKPLEFYEKVMQFC